MATNSPDANNRPSGGAPAEQLILASAGRKSWRSKQRLLGIFTGAIVVIVVISLVITGAIPLIPIEGGGHALGPTTEQSALPLAATYAINVSGGPWALQEIVGFDTTLDMTLLLGRTPCPLGGPRLANFTLPGYNRSYSTGLAEAWLFEFVSLSAPSAALLLLARSGTIEDLGKLPSPVLAIELPDCITTWPYPIPVGAYNGPAAALAVTATPNGSIYVASHLHQNASYDLRMLGENNSSLIPMWFIVFSGCSSHNETALLASVYALNNTVESTRRFPTVFFLSLWCLDE